MHKKILPALLCSSLALAGLWCPPAGSSGAEADSKAVQLQKILLKKGLRVKLNEPEFAKVGEIKTIQTRFYTQQAYFIGVVGDSTVANIDVALYDHKGNLLAHDKDVKDLAVAATQRVAASHDAYIRVRISACKGGAKGGHFALVVAH